MKKAEPRPLRGGQEVLYDSHCATHSCGYAGIWGQGIPLGGRREDEAVQGFVEVVAAAGMDGEAEGCKAGSPCIVIWRWPIGGQLGNAVSQNEAREAGEAFCEQRIRGQCPIVAAPQPEAKAAGKRGHASQGFGGGL